MKLSVIIPVFNEEANVGPLYQRLRQVVPRLCDDWEFLFIDDGSTDGSCAALIALHKQDPHVKVLSFSRNFGHQAALTAGLDAAQGDAVVLMDADLQHPPEMLEKLLEPWRQGYEVVHTVRQSSGGFHMKALTSSLFYRLFRLMTGVELAVHAADFRLLDKKVVRALRSLQERTRFLRGMTVWVGYRSTAIPYHPDPRLSGQTKYSWSRMTHFALDGLVSFSTAPLHWAIYSGFLLSVLGVAEIFYALAMRFITHHVLPGWTSLIIWISLIGGLQLVLMGISGIYIAKIYEEVKQRPLYLVRQQYGFPDRPQADPSSL